MSESIFYSFEKFDENEFFFALRDGYPVTPLHTLIVPQRHIISYFELNPTEHQNLFPFLERQKNKILSEDPSVTAFNIGINIIWAILSLLFMTNSFLPWLNKIILISPL